MKEDIAKLGDIDYLIQSFDDNHGLKEIILLGKNGGVRRLILDDENEG